MTDLSGPSTVKVVVVVLAVLAFVVLVGGLVVGMATNMGHHGSSGPAQTPYSTSGPAAAVDMQSFAFTPYDLTIDVGATVTWTNHDNAPHDAVADDEAWKTDLIDDGEEDSITFDDTGVFPYHCSVHPYMEGTITVR